MCQPNLAANKSKFCIEYENKTKEFKAMETERLEAEYRETIENLDQKVREFEFKIKALSNEKEDLSSKLKHEDIRFNRLLNKYNKVREEQDRYDESSEFKLHFDLESAFDITGLKFICEQSRLPPMKRIYFKHATKCTDGVKKLLRDKFPLEVDLFSINKQTNSFDDECPDVSSYMEAFENSLPYVKKEICLRDFTMDSEQFVKIIGLCKNAEIIQFKRCALILDDEFQFIDQPTKTKCMYFGAIGHEKRSDWVNHIERLRNLFKALNTCPFKGTMEKVGFYNNKIEYKKIKQVYVEEEVEGLQLINNVPSELAD